SFSCSYSSVTLARSCCREARKVQARIRARREGTPGSLSTPIVVPRRISFDQPDEHSDNPLQSLFSGPNLVGSQLLFCNENVESGSAFEGRTMGGVEKPTPVLGRIFPIALGDVQGD